MDVNETPSLTYLPLIMDRVVVKTGAISASLNLVEPVLYIPSYDGIHPDTKKHGILRGRFTLTVNIPVKIEQIVIRFRGKTRIYWPGGATRTLKLRRSSAN